jgi:hypothetical protein
MAFAKKPTADVIRCIRISSVVAEIVKSVIVKPAGAVQVKGQNDLRVNPAVAENEQVRDDLPANNESNRSYDITSLPNLMSA